ncbi:MAG: helix-turn-helix transcriptional regulator [Rhizobiales bacterium]|nr:helix-turn-helix transcriptional regulator [Hyphomicrobiales bacterium]
MNDSHPMAQWAERNGKTVKELAEAARCSDSHMRNILAGRKEASLRAAKRLSELSGGEVPMGAFVLAATEEARA